MNLGITGHRPHKLGGYDPTTSLCWPIQAKMNEFFLKKAPERIISGMALGTDQWAVEVALAIGIKVTALIPCLDQDRLWPQPAQTHYQMLLGRIKNAGGEIQFVSSRPYDKWCMNNRNKAIVEISSEMLGVWDGTRGGTKSCVRLAISDGIPVTILNPKTMEFSECNQST